MKTLNSEAVKIEKDLILLDQKLRVEVESGRMTREEFSEKTGVNEVSVRHWLNGIREFSWKKIIKMAKAFK
jgi:transcriptional regulator with XRE-family HTH domain